MRVSYPSAVNTAATQSIWTGERSVSEATAFLVDTVRYLRRKLVFLILWVMAFVASSVVYTKLLSPDFIATTQILLQPHVIVNDGPEDLRHFYQFVIDSDQCDTELRVLSSQKILYEVFKTQKLTDAPEILAGADGLWAFIGTRLDRFQRQVTTDPDAIQAFNAFLRRVRARRLGLSYVIEISYRAPSAEQATRIVNAIASTYAAYRLRGVLAREQRRGVYLESRLSSLVGQILVAEAGARFGVIPEGALFDSDVRLLGPANRPLGVAYPRMSPLMMMMGGLGLVSGLLLLLLSRGAPVRHTGKMVASVAIQRA
ncbi:hypothetical protein FV242_26035 [Methylobacterium sp. WL64]|uniref:hypothetical protein n=1 Tax=Methylobacterium sp. WL64 TaxID=2603894 RepID=UPI0011CC1AEF|nr:hypothetical protein [Methylobacterium sp. WL64]TXM99296.1 hypothetical protein FV242_26035 [Methylobacterium sp. WL64]